MKLQGLLLSFLIPFTFYLKAQKEPTAYTIYNKKGEKVSFQSMAGKLEKADVILFGELHNNPIVHWLQVELTKTLYDQRKDELILGAEMFEADKQLVVDEYLAGRISHSSFSKEARVWKNYETDYRPLLDFAKEHNLRFIATNVPRRYASMVAANGVSSLDSLTTTAREFMVPLPLHLDVQTPGYEEISHMSHGGEMSSENFVNAQALKDATMAYFIGINRNSKQLLLHFNGDFHSRQYGGIYWHLTFSNPKLNVMTISSNESESLEFLPEYQGQADFILLTPSNLTKTY